MYKEKETMELRAMTEVDPVKAGHMILADPVFCAQALCSALEDEQYDVACVLCDRILELVREKAEKYTEMMNALSSITKKGEA